MVLSEYGQPLELGERAQRPPGPGQTQIRVDAAALCGSDIHAQHGGYEQPGGRFAGLQPPLVLGHQIAGRVEARAAAGPPAVGERCVVFCYRFCGACRRCLEGRQNLCQEVAQRIGFETEGGFAEYVTVDDHNVFPAPDGLDPAQVSVLPDAVATSYHAIRRGGIRAGELVAILGVGALGLYAVRIAALRGARVVAVDRVDDERLRIARRFGAEHALAWDRPPGDGLAERIRDLAGAEPDAVVDLVGSTDTLAAVPALVRRGGRAVVVGVAGRGRLALAPFAARGVDVTTSLASTPSDLLDVLALAEAGRIEPVVAQRLPLEKLNAGMERLARGEVVGRLVVIP